MVFAYGTELYLKHAKTYSARHGPLTRYVKLRVAHAPGMPGTFPSPSKSKETASYRSRHASRHVRDARAVMHVGIDNPRWRGKRSRHSRRMRNPQFYVSGKRPMAFTQYLKCHCCCALSRLGALLRKYILLVIYWNEAITRWAPSQYKDRLIYVWRFPC